MKVFIAISFFLAPLLINAQAYNTSLLADSLTQNADAVKRFEEIDIEIKSPSKATIREHHVYTILNEKASDLANYKSSYDQFTSINYIDGILYDENGKEIKHVKKKDMPDVSGSDDETLMTDTRYKVNNFYYQSYPYTVDYNEEDDVNGLLGLESWLPLDRNNLSVQYSKYVITAPSDYLVRYKELNFKQSPSIITNGDKKIYTWEIKNLVALKEEIMSSSITEISPMVIFAPSDFEAQGYKGNMSTWENYGKFIEQLKSGRDVLPDVIKTKVHELTDNVKDEKEKVCVLYDFLQKNTRYISIQLGIGGWQPFDASYVATKKYGDCKALSNYMVSLLKEAGIKANYVEVSAGKYAHPLIEDFPCFQSNHVITCVPMAKDTMWLECTSQDESPGYMGSFTGDRKAILIDENGGHIVSTPTYTSNDNSQLRTVDASIDENGNLDANVITNYSGIQEETSHSLINDATSEERKRYLNHVFSLPSYEIDKSEYTETKGIIPKCNERLHLTSSSYANVSGKRIFIVPDILNKEGYKFSEDSVRKFDIVYKYAFKDIDSIHIKIPDGYAIEALPQNIDLNNKFGIYKINFKVDGNTIVCVRTHIRNRSRFPASEYKNFVQFSNAIYKADRSKMVLVKKDS